LPVADNLHNLTKKGSAVGGSGEGERLRKRSKTPRKDEFTEFSQGRGNGAFEDDNNFFWRKDNTTI